LGKGINFVELVYSSQLLQFMSKVSCGILMEDGALVYCNKSSKQWRKLCLLEKLGWLANGLDLNPLDHVRKLLRNAIQHGQRGPRNLEELTMTLERE
jgi:hypothetical protein